MSWIARQLPVLHMTDTLPQSSSGPTAVKYPRPPTSILAKIDLPYLSPLFISFPRDVC